jgi:RecB family exonuclease
VITPRRTRLVRVPELGSFRRTVALLSSEPPQDLFRSNAVVVPTRGAAHQLARTLSGHAGNPERVALLTRDELYTHLNARLSAPHPILTACEREVMLHSAAGEAIAAGQAPPFGVRPGLVAEMMRFYDQLRRQGQSVRRFEELIGERLQGDDDRGAVRLLEQTRFLAASFRAYERRLEATGAVDEHALREHLISVAPATPLTGLVLTVGDWIADPHGLAGADFDLLTRIPGLERIDLVATEGLLRSGFHQRIHDWLPGLEEVDGSALGARSSPPPREFVVPVCRDREEELVSVARRVKTEDVDLDRVAVVFNRPLPYLYLAREVFGGARLPYQTIDALPLAAEPIAAGLDLVIEFASSQFTRDATLALLSSPHFTFGSAEPITRATIADLDQSMRDARYMGELEKLLALDVRNAALASVVAAAQELQPLLDKAPASSQVNRLLRFLTSHADDEGDERTKRGRAALVDVLQRLASAYAAHGDRNVTIDDLAPDIRRWIEEATFVPESSGSGLHLLDAHAARFGEFDDVTLVGLVEGEWPERPKRNIFYAPSVLSALGWPPERDRRSAGTAAFLDLVTSASRHVTLSTFTLDDEALVEPSTLVDDVAGLALTRVDASVPPLELESPEDEAPEWAAMRARRTAGSDARYHGAAGPQEARALSVSAVETYLTCPFKYFAQYVLKLEEERDEEEVMDPKTQGQFVHAVFEAFFNDWQNRGHRGITPDNLVAARALFAEVVEEKVGRLSEPEAALERTRLLGSTVAAGLGEVVFRMEAERPTPVRERLLEYRFRGEFDFAGPRGPKRIALKGVADRLDLLEDGTIRLIDYKLSSAPSKSRALQLPIYGLCAEQRLTSYHGRDWTLGEAAYIAFRGARKVTPLFTARSDRAEVLSTAQEKLIDAVENIERGAFPPTPEDVFLCGFCSYAAVCRKDYVGDV